MLPLIPVSRQNKLVPSWPVSPCATIYLYPATWVETNFISLEAFRYESFETWGVLVLPKVGTSRWKRALRGVLDQGKLEYSFACTFTHLQVSGLAFTLILR
jgi:hypothetical protein